MRIQYLDPSCSSSLVHYSAPLIVYSNVPYAVNACIKNLDLLMLHAADLLRALVSQEKLVITRNVYSQIASKAFAEKTVA